jgi:hypothetical protein
MKTLSTRVSLLGAGVALAAMIAAGTASAQLPEHLRDYPLTSRKASGDAIAPMFNGWIANEDGSVTMIFGFANKNSKEIVDIPLGVNNRLEPQQFDGVQPTHFPSYTRRGFVGIQERGVFSVTVPAEMKGTEVVWHLAHGGFSYDIPGRATSSSYEMSHSESALGSLNPAIRFDMSGAESTDRGGIYASRVKAKVGVPVSLLAHIQDRGNRADYPENKMLQYPLGTEWIMHQGPAAPQFEQGAVTGKQRAENRGEEASSGSNGWSEVATQATFSEPGEYILRLRVDNFEAPDSQFDNQCCWSNAYVPVTVTP